MCGSQLLFSRSHRLPRRERDFFLTMLAILMQDRWVRSGVKLKRTTVAADPHGMGLFAPAGGLRKGSFIGVYRAERWTLASSGAAYKGSNEYVMQVGDWRAMPRLPRMEAGKATMKADVTKFPIMAAQEPPPGVIANCIFMAFYDPREIGVAGCAFKLPAIFL